MIEAIRQGLKDDGFDVAVSKLCRWFEVPRRTVYYKPTKAAPKVNVELAAPIKALIEQEPSFGYRTVAGMLSMNKNTVQRVFQLMGWQVRKRAVGRRPRIQALITRYGTLGCVRTPFLLRSDNGLVFTSHGASASQERCVAVARMATSGCRCSSRDPVRRLQATTAVFGKRSNLACMSIFSVFIDISWKRVDAFDIYGLHVEIVIEYRHIAI